MRGMMRISVCALLLALLGPAAEISASQVVTLGDGEPALELLDQQAEALHYRATLGRIEAVSVETPEGLFTRLEIPGYHRSHRIGEPELPQMNRLVEIPFGASCRVEIQSVRTREIDLAALGIAAPVLPAQPSLAKNADPRTLPFHFDRSLYLEDQDCGAEWVKVAETGSLRAVRIGRCEVAPVRYNPARGMLTVVDEIEFTLHFSGGDLAREIERKALTRSPFFQPIYDQIDGYRGLHDQYPDHVRDVATLVVVTPPMFENQLADFMAWKTQRGFICILGVTGTPEVGTTKEEIRDYIHGLYENATPEQPAPSFVIFVGDIAQMPTWTEGGDVTDRPYCDVEGDLVPDIYYGRFSATNPSQLQNILDKTLMYEMYDMPDPSYLHEVVMIAGMDAGHGAVWANGQINYGTTYYFNADHDILSHTYLYPNSGNSDAQIIQDVSEGVSYVNYTAHGSETSWSDPYFAQSDVNGLQNAGKYCLAVGNCCLTSSYEVAECFAETWLRAANKGAIGYIGGSNSTYWDEDYWWGVGAGPVVTNPTYETHGIGAYTGVFHDHGEAMTQWYVTNDALIFSGNVAVMEAGSGMVNYYWTIYNLMGDPSISSWIGTPQVNPVSHAGTLFTTSTELAITAAPGSYCGLSQGGDLVGAGTVGETGQLDLEIWQVLTPGPAQLVVMAQFCEPHVAEINVIIPAVIVMDPTEIDANTPATVSVGVFESDGVTPKPGIHVWAEGLDYITPASVTGPDGACELDITYAYGPSIEICGQVPGDPWYLFEVPLSVNAAHLPNIALRVTTQIGLDNAFAMNLPGTLEAHRPMGGGALPVHELWGFVNDEPGLMTTENSLVLTPASLGLVRGVFAVEGYDLIERTFPVIEAFGTLTGHVAAGGESAVGAVVRGWNAAMELAFEDVTDAAGNYDMGEDILVADYTLTVALFGSLPYEEPFFLNYGVNVHDIVLAAAPAGVMAGTVKELGSGLPLAATVRIYRSDTEDLFDEVATNPATGDYTTGPLPFFDYAVEIVSGGHIPVHGTVSIDEAVVLRDWLLEETIGAILLIDDSAKGPVSADDLAGKNGEPFSYDDYHAQESKAIDAMREDLEYLGYAVVVEPIGSTDPASWSDYDMLMSCSGDNVTTLNNTAIRTAMISFVQGGGRLLIEGGEVGYDHYSSGSFASVVLHINGWGGDESGSLTVVAPSHPVMSSPNPITGPITVAYSYWGDQDALDAANGGVRIGSWTSAASDASVIVYDDDAAPEEGQIVFFCWNYAAMDAQVRPLLLQNALAWLLPVNTAVDEPIAATPSCLKLERNHPNPFNPKTQIAFELPAAGAVDLAVFDLRGRLLKTLVAEALPAGPHVCIWDGKDAQGQPAASGVYFYRLRASGEVLTRKMLLVK